MCLLCCSELCWTKMGIQNWKWYSTFCCLHLNVIKITYWNHSYHCYIVTYVMTPIYSIIWWYFIMIWRGLEECAPPVNILCSLFFKAKILNGFSLLIIFIASPPIYKSAYYFIWVPLSTSSKQLQYSFQELLGCLTQWTFTISHLPHHYQQPLIQSWNIIFPWLQSHHPIQFFFSFSLNVNTVSFAFLPYSPNSWNSCAPQGLVRGRSF